MADGEKRPMMLVVQTAEEMLYVPGEKVATLMPTYPDRWRVVLSDGRVGHLHGELPEGPWVRLGAGWARPEWLRREGDSWLDPADFRYAYEPLGEPVEEEVAEEELPAGLLAVEKRGKEWVWRTDSQESACGLNVHQLRELFPQLLEVGQRLFVYMPRVRRFGSGSGNGGGWLELDQGERVKVNGETFAPKLAGYLGLQSLSTQDPSVLWKLWRLREFPFDLSSADPERIRRALPDAKIFSEQLMWQTVLRYERGETLEFGCEAMSFFDYLVAAGKRCGYEYPRERWGQLRLLMVLHSGAVRLRQLGQRELDASLRRRGERRPQVVLLAPLKQKAAARQAALGAGISLLVVGREYHLSLECLAYDVPGPYQLLVWGLEDKVVQEIRRRLDLMERDSFGAAVRVEDLDRLAEAVARLPVPTDGEESEPLRRVAVEDFQGLYFARPEEIVAWKASRPARWQVELVDGRQLHHPGPVPQPLTPPPPLPGGPGLPCLPEQVLWLEARDGLGVWHLEEGREVVSELTYGEAMEQHRGLLPISRRVSLNYNRIQRTYFQNRPVIQLDSGHDFPVPMVAYGQKLRERLGLKSLRELARDAQGLRKLQLRDVPYEIVRANAARLRADFSGLLPLIANIIWQVHCGLYKYGDSFSGFFYFPLQAVLYRAGYLTRAQLRAEWRVDSAKDRLYQKYCDVLTSMVRDFRLFTYQELGFVDDFAHKRVLGEGQPHRILLVEKGDKLEANARLLQQETGMTLVVLQGTPSLLASEYFVAALRKVYSGPVEVYFYGDFDFAGWDIGPAFIRHLLFYGVECLRFERLVLPSIFTIEEQNLYSRPLVPKTENNAGWLRRFMRESGGVQGRERGIHANWLQPYARLQQRLLELLG